MGEAGWIGKKGWMGRSEGRARRGEEIEAGERRGGEGEGRKVGIVTLMNIK